MTTLMKSTLAIGLCLVHEIAIAEDILLPAPVLQWSFYIFLMFALAVGVGIFFVRTKKSTNEEPLGNIIDSAASTIHSVGPGTTVSDCVRSMNEHRIGAMLVMEEDRLIGIFTERDSLTKVVGAGLDPVHTTVSEVMTDDPVCVSPATTLEEAMNIVSTHRFRHLPVVEDSRVLGMVSSGDLTYRLVSDRSIEIRELVQTAGRRRASL